MPSRQPEIQECTYLYRIPFYIGRHKSTTPDFRPQERLLRLHYHRGVEMMAVLGGSGAFYLKDKPFALEPGDVVFLDSMVLHESVGRSLDLIVVHLTNQLVINAHLDTSDLSLLRPFLAIRSGCPPVLKKQPHLVNGMQRALDAYMSKDSFSKLRAWNTMQQVIIDLAAAVDELASGGTFLPREQNAIVARMVEILERRFAEDVSLSDIARELCTSVSNASHLFKKYIGTSPVEYRNHLRITHAIDLLKMTDEKISGIASDCGFESLSQFNRLFKRIAGSSPSAFRAGAT